MSPKGKGETDWPDLIMPVFSILIHTIVPILTKALEVSALGDYPIQRLYKSTFGAVVCTTFLNCALFVYLRTANSAFSRSTGKGNGMNNSLWKKCSAVSVSFYVILYLYLGYYFGYTNYRLIVFLVSMTLADVCFRHWWIHRDEEDRGDYY